jgi:hypothetical protein
MLADGSNVVPARSAVTWTGAFAFEVAARIAMTSLLSIDLRGGVDVSLRPITLELARQAVWTLPAVALRFGVGVAWGIL